MTESALRGYVPHSVLIETLVSHISGIYTLRKTSICTTALKMTGRGIMNVTAVVLNEGLN